ncbi:hypothetical protein K449DRAFT_97051 [Hypoxylon sp. EC38]|nr:hypothetical protein K449DRAFT_97051 [Hypoxylon sp. EC38]
MTIPPLSPNITSSGTSFTTSAAPAPSGVTPTHTRTITLSTVHPSETYSSSVDPAIINDYTLLGCFQSDSGHPFFSQVASHSGMDTGACVGHCAGRKYAGVHGDTCYCADAFGDARAVGNRMCDVPCSGNGDEVCGGRVDSTERHGPLSLMINSAHSVNSSATHRRDTLANILLTVYGNLDDEPMPPAAPAMGGNPTNTYPMISEPNTTVTTAIIVTYSTICSTNPASLVELEYSTTVTYEECGCTKTNTKTTHYPVGTANLTTTHPASTLTTYVPMTTCTETCQACGPHGESTVTLTVPVAVVTEVVTSIAVQTVVPVISNTTYAAPAYGTGARITPSPQPSATPSNTMPVLSDAPPRGMTSAILQTLGWGVAIWFGLFGFMLVL